MIELKNITKKFEDKLIFKNINLKFENGNKYIIVGESGIGKTTLLNIICGYTPLDNGIVIKDNDVKIQYLFQEQLLFTNMTVIENLYIKYCSNIETCLPILEYKDLFMSVLNDFSLSEVANKQVSLLSGGEKQRVQLAQIALFNPDIILMDEPTSNLDKANKLKFAKLVDYIFNEKLIIIVSHDDPYIFKNPYILELKEGRLREINENKCDI
ncbi:MAG: ATP-binding cassette domain-containing protein [Paraclostridium sp.]